MARLKSTDLWEDKHYRCKNVALQNGKDANYKKQQYLFLLRVNSSHFYSINIFLLQPMRKYIKLVTLMHVKATNMGPKRQDRRVLWMMMYLLFSARRKLKKWKWKQTQLGVRGSSRSSGHWTSSCSWEMVLGLWRRPKRSEANPPGILHVVGQMLRFLHPLLAHRDPTVDKQSSAAHFSRNTKEAADTAAEGSEELRQYFIWLLLKSKQGGWGEIQDTRVKLKLNVMDYAH